MTNATRAAVLLASIVSAAPPPPDTPAGAPHAESQREADRRDGVIRAAPPSCTGEPCDVTRPFRFRGGTSF